MLFFNLYLCILVLGYVVITFLILYDFPVVPNKKITDNKIKLIPVGVLN